MDGIISLWKEAGMTSNDCVMTLKKILGTKKVGHAGTLDPSVSGVLPICVGRATKVIEFLMDKEKIYQGQITLGFATETEDLEGEVIERKSLCAPLSLSRIQKAAKQLEGLIWQTPPLYSAIKVNGRRLYDYARKGEKVERPRRQVFVREFTINEPLQYIESLGEQSFSFQIVCGRGTYIRTLATDLGNILAYPATMTSLVRESSGPFKRENSITLAQIKASIEKSQSDFILPLEMALSNFPIWHAPDELIQGIKNGQVLPLTCLPKLLQTKLPVRIYTNGQLIALYQNHPCKKGVIKPLKMF